MARAIGGRGASDIVRWAARFSASMELADVLHEAETDAGGAADAVRASRVRHADQASAMRASLKANVDTLVAAASSSSGAGVGGTM